MVRCALVLSILAMLALPAGVFAQDGGSAADAAADLDTSASSSANVNAVTVFNVDDFGIVSVIDTWNGLAQESGTYLYVSATRELGRIPVRVKDHKFTMNFATRSYLIEDKDDTSVVFFRTPMYIYEGGGISIDITVNLPSRLSYVGLAGNTPEPTSVEPGKLRWVIPDATGVTIALELKRNKPFLVPGEGGPQFDPALLPRLSQEEIPKNADEVLRELETILLIAQMEKSADPDLIKLLNKNLTRLYYLFYLYGLVADYRPSGETDGSG